MNTVNPDLPGGDEKGNEDELKEKVGVEFSRGPIWEPYMVTDRNLVTGQNPHSAGVLAEQLLKVLE